MSDHNINNKLVRYTLGVLLLLIAINAFGGGYYGMAGAKNVPVEWLKGSFFRNYFIPGLILFVFIGWFGSFWCNCCIEAISFGTYSSIYMWHRNSYLAFGTDNYNRLCFMDATHHSSGCYYNRFFNLLTS